MATATFSITNSTLDDNNLFKTEFVCEIAGASPYQDCQMQLSYYSPSAQGDVSLDSVYGTADGEGNAVLSYKLDGNRDVGGEPLASIIFPSDGSTTSINCAALNSAEVIGFERFTLTLDAPPIFSDVTISNNFIDGVYIQNKTTISVSAKIEPRFGSSIASAAVYLTDSVGGSVHMGMAYSALPNKWFGYVNVTTNTHSGNALLSIQATSGRGIYNYNIAEIIVQEHTFPSITVDCFRCDSNGDRDMNGNYISVTGFASSNPAELGLSYLRGSVYIYPGGGGSAVYQSLTQGVPTLFGEGTITPENAYTVRLVTSDGDYSSSKEIVIPPVVRIINVKDGGTGVAFGKLATEDALLDSAWDINTDGEYLVQGQPLVDTLPDADTSTRGLVSTGAQTFAGEKKFLVRPTVSGSIRYPGVNYVSTNGSSLSNRVGLEYIDTGSATFGQMGDACWSVEVYGNDGNGGISPYRERYLLPFVTVGRTNNANYRILTSKEAVTIAQGGTGQTGQTAQQSYTPTVKIGTTAQTVSSLSAYYKSWGLMKLIGGRFNLTTTGTGSLIISLPTGFTVPTSAVQPMGVLIAPDQKVYHIRVAAEGLSALSNGGGSVAWTTGYYCFWAVVMGN